MRAAPVDNEGRDLALAGTTRHERRVDGIDRDEGSRELSQ
jgi:hypothetical protein